MALADLCGPIVHVVQHLRPGGLEVMVLELARAQARLHPTVVVSLDGDFEQALDSWPRLKSQQRQLIFLGKQPGVDLKLPFRLRALFTRIAAGGVHTHHIGPLLYAGAAARLAGVDCLVHTEHDAWHLQNAKRRRIVQLALAVSRPILVADAPHVAEAVAKELSRPAPIVILNGVDTTRFSPGGKAASRRSLDLPEQGKIIGIAARLERVKGVDLAIEALQAVPDALLAIAGSGGEREKLEALTASLGLTHRVRWLGHVDDMARLYRAIDILCLPSRDEGLPLALLEAQSTNTRVVAMRVGGVAAGVDPATGILVDPAEPGGLARALQLSLHEDAANGPGPRSFVERIGSLTTMASAYTALMLGATP